MVVGGTDESTKLANTAIITAPVDATVVNPLTTLVNDVMLQTGATEATAMNDAGDGMGISTGIDLDKNDLIQTALTGSIADAHAFAAEVKVSSLIYDEDGLLSGATRARRSLSTNAFASLAAAIVGGNRRRPEPRWRLLRCNR